MLVEGLDPNAAPPFHFSACGGRVESLTHVHRGEAGRWGGATLQQLPEVGVVKVEEAKEASFKDTTFPQRSQSSSLLGFLKAQLVVVVTRRLRLLDARLHLQT